MTNLLDNALLHGAQPIAIEVRRQNMHVAIHVLDAGPQPQGRRSLPIAGSNTTRAMVREPFLSG